MHASMMKKGTTLIELIVAMGIIITGILTVVGLITRSINLGTQTRNDLVAVGIAQEGIEAARAIRDGNALLREAGSDAVAWNTDLYNDLSGSIDYTAIATVEYDYANNPQKLDTGVWLMEFGPNSVTEADARVYQYVDSHADYPNLFFQELGLTPNPVFETATQYSRLVTLEPICISGNTLTQELEPIPVNLSNTDASCDSGQIGIRVASTVEWPGRNGMNESLTLTQDIYDWR
jgi:type II secretory pathway pseudopilin PulG